MSKAPSTSGKGDKRRAASSPGLYEVGYDSIDWHRPTLRPAPQPTYDLRKTLDTMKDAEEEPVYRFMSGGHISG